MVTTLIAVWVFRRRRDNTRAGWQSSWTRLISGLLIALVIPPSGDFPFGALLLDAPRQVLHRDEKWLVAAVAVPFFFAVCAGVIYVLMTLAFWLSTGRLARASVDPMHKSDTASRTDPAGDSSRLRG